MVTTYRTHFDDDMARAQSLLDLAGGGAPALKLDRRKDDLRLAAVAMAVGAMDAYFCDAYVDCLARALRRCANKKGDLPPAYAKQNLPAGIVLGSSQTKRPNWRLRMAARAVMERDNILDLSRVPGLFNPVLPRDKQLWPAVIDSLILLRKRRLTGVDHATYKAAPPTSRAKMKKAAAGVVAKRMKETIQWRHDWVHNCGRPKSAIQDRTQGEIQQRINEIYYLVEAFDSHLTSHRTV